jgi:hypothetical protein
MAECVTSYSDLTRNGGRIWTRDRERNEKFSFKIGRERDHLVYLGLVVVVMMSNVEHMGCDYMGRF